MFLIGLFMSYEKSSDTRVVVFIFDVKFLMDSLRDGKQMID
jgi:hypothetical protein